MRNPGKRPHSWKKLKAGKEIGSFEPERKNFTVKVNSGWGHEKKDKKDKEKKIPNSTAELFAERKRVRAGIKDSQSG